MRATWELKNRVAQCGKDSSPNDSCSPFYSMGSTVESKLLSRDHLSHPASFRWGHVICSHLWNLSKMILCHFQAKMVKKSVYFSTLILLSVICSNEHMTLVAMSWRWRSPRPDEPYESLQRVATNQSERAIFNFIWVKNKLLVFESLCIFKFYFRV